VPACDNGTDIARAGEPAVVVKDMLPLRVVPAFATVRMVTVALPVPDDGLTLAQSGAVAVHDVFDDTDMVVDAPSRGMFVHMPGDTINVGGMPACDKNTDHAGPGESLVVLNVTLFVRVDAVVFAATVNVTVVFPTPDDGLTLTHDGANAAHDVFDVTVIVVDPPEVGIFTHEPGDIDNVGAPAWDNATDAVDEPFASRNNAVPLRVDPPEFAAAVNVTVALPVQAHRLALTHVGVESDHDVFDVTVTVTDPPPARMADHDAGDTDNVDGTVVAELVAVSVAHPSVAADTCTDTGNPTSTAVSVWMLAIAPAMGTPPRNH